MIDIQHALPLPMPRPAGRTRGFSLIEILVVVGILAVLISLAVVGFKVVGGASRGKVTNVALENCAGLLSEYKSGGGTLNDMNNNLPLSAMTGLPYRWNVPSAVGVPIDVLGCSVTSPDVNNASPNSVETSADVRAQRERYLRDETARVIRELMRNPSNRKSIESFSPDRIQKVRFPNDLTQVPTVSNGVAEYGTGVAVVDGVNLLDGFGHSVYFVPGGGILYVNVGYKGKGDLGDPANYDRQVAVRAVDHQPFWASAGPDGDLSAGDDNVYSTAIDMK